MSSGLISIVAAVLLLLGSGLIFYALLQLERRYPEPGGEVSGYRAPQFPSERRRTLAPGHSPGAEQWCRQRGVRLLASGSER